MHEEGRVQNEGLQEGRKDVPPRAVEHLWQLEEDQTQSVLRFRRHGEERRE